MKDFYKKLLREESTESRSRNRLSKKDGNDICQTYDNTYVKHMENENININKDLNKDLNTNKKKKFKGTNIGRSY